MNDRDQADAENGQDWRNTELLRGHAAAASRDGLVVVDPETMQILAANDTIATILGRRLDQVIHHFPWEWDIRFGREELVALGGLIAQGEHNPDGCHESVIRRPDGVLVDVEISISRVEHEGKPQLFIACRDISARKAAEQALDRQTQFYRQAMNSMIDGIVLFESLAYPTVIECNAAFARMLGYDSPAELVGLHPWDWDVDITHDVVADLARPGGIGFDRQRFEVRHRRRDGSIFDAEVTITDFEVDGESYSYCIVRDLTEIKHVQKEREASELRARLATESAGIGIWEWDVRRDCSTCTPLVFDLLEIDSTDAIDEEAWLARIHPDDLSRYRMERKAHLDGHTQSYKAEIRVRRWDGSYKWVSDFGRVIQRDPEGQPLRVVGTIRDINARKNAEIALADSRKELEQRERLLSSILGQIPGGVALSDEETHRIVEFNDHAAAMHGYSREEFAALSVSNLKQAVTRTELDDRREQARAKGTFVFEDIHRRKDGSTFETQVRLSRMHVEGRWQTLALWIDISDLKQTERELREQQDLLSAVFDHARGGVLLFDEETWEIVQFNDHAAVMHGYSREEFARLNLHNVKEDCSPDATEEQRHLVRMQGAISFEDVHRRKDGSTFDVQIRADRIQVAERNYALALWTDISELKAAQRTLAAQKEEIRGLIEHSPDGMVRYNRDLRRIYVNAAMRNFIGPSVDKITGKKLRTPGRLALPAEYITALKETFRTGEGTQIEIPYSGPKGEPRWGLVNFAPEYDAAGEVATVLVAVRDISALVEQRNKVHQLAYSDALTGLANRNAFNERFADVLKTCRKTGTGAALLLFDLDRFKDINDSLGHGTGDDLLRQIGIRLSADTRHGDILARLGGDEFAVLIPDCTGKRCIEAVVERIHQAFHAPFDLGQREIFASATIGVAVFPEDGLTSEDLFAHADTALYSAKSLGRGGMQFYTQGLSDEAAQRLALLTDLKGARQRGEFELVYQPKVALSDGTCVGAEALLRWRHPEHGMMSPDKFISLAEETGTIVEIGRWVLLEACRTVAKWNHLSKMPLRVAVNLSGRQFVDNDIATDVRNALTASGCPGEWLECEITESLMLNDDESVLNALAEIGSMGATVAIDDFGTGQSALGYLNRFHVDVLKVDRSFVSNMECDWRKAELVKAFISMADALDMETVAEGIENSDQLRILLRLGCSIGQGYYFSEPVSETLFRHLFLGKHLTVGPMAQRVRDRRPSPQKSHEDEWRLSAS